MSFDPRVGGDEAGTVAEAGAGAGAGCLWWNKCTLLKSWRFEAWLTGAASAHAASAAKPTTANPRISRP